MSRERLLQALNLQNPDIIPHWVWLQHPEFISDATGVDYRQKPLTATIHFHKRFDVDWGGPTDLNDNPGIEHEADASGEKTDEGFGTVWHRTSPFANPEQLWNFDPDPWGPDCEKAKEVQFATKNFRWAFEPETWKQVWQPEDEMWQGLEKLFPGKFTEGCSFYCTSFMWAICIFGWDVFLTALGLDPDKTGQTIQRISEISVKIHECFATRENARYLIAHDDLCTSGGPITSPQWYKKYIYPVYEQLFSIVKAKGQRILLLSDGNITKLAKDIAPLVDGFCFEHSTSSEYMFKNFGSIKCLLGGVDGRILTFGTKDEVKTEVKKVIDMASNCPGFILACSSTIPANVPIENVYTYFDTVEKYRNRRVC